MKYSQLIGVVATLSLMVACTLPWIYVPTLHLTLDGFHGYVNQEMNFGKQGIGHLFFGAIMLLCFAIPNVTLKRVNIFIALLNMAWGIKNYIIFSMCRQGECPNIQPALYFVVALGVVIQVMTFLPNIKVKE